MRRVRHRQFETPRGRMRDSFHPTNLADEPLNGSSGKFYPVSWVSNVMEKHLIGSF